MPTTEEIVSGIRNKLQTPYLITERVAEGRMVPEKLIKLAQKDLGKIEELLLMLNK